MDALAEGALDRFACRLAGFAAEHFPDVRVALGDGGVQAAAQHAISRARTHGITSERDICRYFSLSLALGSNFENQEWASRILDSAMVGPMKMDMLFEHGLEAAHRSAGLAREAP